MAESTITGIPSGDRESQDSISIVQRGNLKTLEQTLRRQWRLGQNIVLCWSADERGVLQTFVLHWIDVLRAQRTPRELRWQLDIDPLEV